MPSHAAVGQARLPQPNGLGNAAQPVVLLLTPFAAVVSADGEGRLSKCLMHSQHDRYPDRVAGRGGNHFVEGDVILYELLPRSRRVCVLTDDLGKRNQFLRLSVRAPLSG